MGLKNPYKCVFKALDNFAPRKKKYSRESNVSFMDKNFEKLPHEKKPSKNKYLQIWIQQNQTDKVRQVLAKEKQRKNVFGAVRTVSDLNFQKEINRWTDTNSKFHF